MSRTKTKRTLDTSKFIEALEKYREDNNISQTDFAQRVGVTASVMNSWTHGKSVPSVLSLMLLSEVTGKSVFYWMGLLTNTEYTAQERRALERAELKALEQDMQRRIKELEARLA